MGLPRYQIILLAISASLLAFSIIYLNVFVCGAQGNPTCYGRGTMMTLVDKNVTTQDCIDSDTNESYMCLFEFKLQFKEANQFSKECIISDSIDGVGGFVGGPAYYYDQYDPLVVGEKYPIEFKDDDNDARMPCDVINRKFNTPIVADFWIMVGLIVICSVPILAILCVFGDKQCERKSERNQEHAILNAQETA